MLGEEKIQGILERVLSYSDADQADTLFENTESSLTRFANSHIHQNVSESNHTVSVRLIYGKKIGVASGNDLSEQGLRDLVAKAKTIASFQQENRDFVSLPEPQPIQTVNGYSEATANCSPEDRARMVGIICQQAREAKVTASGALSTETNEFAVRNSRGVKAYFAGTNADASTVITGETSSGYAAASSKDISDIDAEAIAREAVGKAVRSTNPVEVPPGDYEVILESYAVAEMLEFLAYLGFNALSLQEERSFMKLGEKITGSNINIYDNGLDPRNIALPFDFEGVPRQRVDLIKNGIANAVVYDSFTANRISPAAHNTGHALPPSDQTFGPYPAHLFMDPGSTPKADLAKGIKHGIWVTRFWYVRVVHPLSTILTGMTRDGTFLIENGEITHPVKNFRWNQGVLQTLDTLIEAENENHLHKSGAVFGGAVVPSLHLGKFTFSSVTKF